MKRLFFLISALFAFCSLSFAQGNSDQIQAIADKYLSAISKAIVAEEDHSRLSNIAKPWIAQMEKLGELEKYDIPESIKEENPVLIPLIYYSPSMGTSAEKQSWFDLYNLMNQEQIDKLYDILLTETQKLYVQEQKERYDVCPSTLVFDKRSLEFKLVADFKSIGKDPQLEYAVPSNIFSLNKYQDLDNTQLKQYEDYKNYTISYFENVTDKRLSHVPKDMLPYLGEYWRRDLYDLRESGSNIDAEKILCLTKIRFDEMFPDVPEYKICRMFCLSWVEEEKGLYHEACSDYMEYLRLSKPAENMRAFLGFSIHLAIYKQVESCNDLIDDFEQILLDKYSDIPDQDIFWNLVFPLECSPMLSDYLAAVTNNQELSSLYSKMYSECRSRIREPFCYFGQEHPKWYSYFNHSYINGDFDRDLTVDDIRKEVMKFSSQTSMQSDFNSFFSEYLCWYSLKKLSESPGFDASEYMEACLAAAPLTYVENLIASAYLSSHKSSDIDLRNLTPFAINGITDHAIVLSNKSEYLLTGHMLVNSNSILNIMETLPDGTTTDMDLTIDGNEFSHTLDLAEGENRYTVTFSNPIIGQRRISFVIVYDAPAEKFERRKNKAVLFAVNEYDDRMWRNLSHPIQDAKDFAARLSEYGFDVEIVENPTQHEFADVMKRYTSEYESREKNEYDQLLIFFSGHGKYDEDYDEGFLVFKDSPANGDLPFRTSYRGIGALINKINCEHILFISDACYCGTFLASNATKGESDSYENISSNDIKTMLGKRSRLFIGSAEKEVVPDDSEFIKCIINHFDSSLSVITAASIDACLEAIKPMPVSGRFGDGELSGKFIFSHD